MNYEIDGFSLNAVKGNVFTLEMYYTISVGDLAVWGYVGGFWRMSIHSLDRTDEIS